MKKILLALFVLFVLVGCTKEPEPTITEPSYPYVDEDGKLNVDVSDYEFD